MTKRREVYVCQVCGNMVEVLRARSGTLVCCERPMLLAGENTTDAAQEKHIPVVQRAGGQIDVAVGSVAHPMAEDHYIEWIELSDGDQSTVQFLKPGEEPKAKFACPGQETVSARAYCNLHGLWKG